VSGLFAHIQNSYERILKIPPTLLPGELRILVRELMSMPVTASAIARLEREMPGFSVTDWCTTLGEEREFRWPREDTSARSLASWELIKYVAGSSNSHVVSTLARSLQVRTRPGTKDASAQVIELLLHPFFLFLMSELAAQGDLLSDINRFKQKVEWFTRDHLYANYRLNTRAGEAVYDRALREFLFDHGYDLEGGQATSPSGRVDLLVSAPLLGVVPVEIKLLRNSPSVFEKALEQLRRYCDDHGATVGCLLVLSLTEREMRRELERDQLGREFVDLGSKRMYCFFIRAAPPVASASRSKLERPIDLSAPSSGGANANAEPDAGGG
jgi:hypothetical protein